MSPALALRLVAAWLAALAALTAVVHRATRIDPPPPVPEAVRRWAFEALAEACAGRRMPAAPAGAPAAHAVIVDAWVDGRRVARHVGPSLAEALAGAARGDICGGGRRYTVALARASGALARGVPFLSAFALVPMRDGVEARAGGRVAWRTPSDLLASGAYDRGIPTPLPELTLGTDLEALAASMARELGVEAGSLGARGALTRWRVDELWEAPYPRDVEVNEATLRDGAREAARFVAANQQADGRFVYLYDGRTGAEQPGGYYDTTRHAGTTAFLALEGTFGIDPLARRAARLGLAWLIARTTRCGAPDRYCVATWETVDVGSSALGVLAAADYLEGGDDPEVREHLRGWSAFLRAQQRPDGDFMHLYDAAAGRPVDRQFLYFTGEVALALARSHAVLGDARDLEAARRALARLSGPAWDFFGSRYYYGEEHWTCIAVGALPPTAASRGPLDFCLRWAAWNRHLQYGPGETPWDARGMYGVGPVLVPMVTPTGSRTEAFVMTWSLARALGVEVPGLRAQVEQGLAALLRHQWTPGPAHLFASPDGARGGVPMGAASLTARNDYAQHAGNAMIRWAEVLRRERATPSHSP